MIKHIVLFKLKDHAECETKAINAVKIKEMLDRLPDFINEIVEFEVGINIAESGRASDIAIVSSFDSLESLEAYRQHPKHLEAVQFIAPRKLSTTAVDYEY